jgi:hypothetical protein
MAEINTRNITVLFPGGFKPLTGAHMALAERYAANPEVDRVILLIGEKERDGITRNKSIEIFNLMNTNSIIEIQPTAFNSPIMAAYEYIFALPEDANGRYAMAASTKGDDYVRAKDFSPNVDKYKTIGDKKGRKMPMGVDAVEMNIDIDPLLYKNGEPISASSLRAAIANRDYETFKFGYPNASDEIVKNIWQIVSGIQESVFSADWWKTIFEGSMGEKNKETHDAKIKKLRHFLDTNNDKSFQYDFDKFAKTVFGAKIESPMIKESVNSKSLLTEGGAAGHMAHPYDQHGLTFGDMKELISRALAGRLDIEEAVTEKTDGQNIQVTWKNGQIGFARNKGTVVNPMTTAELQAKFDNRGPISEAFGEAGNDLSEAFSKMPQDQLNSIFKNGRVFANMEIIYPATKNVIAYETAVLQFHNLVEYDEAGNIVETDATGGATVQRIIQDANAHMQKTFQIIPPQKIKLGRVSDFEDQQSAFIAEVDQLRNRYNLTDTDLVTEYHKAWWGEIITAKANEFGYDIPKDVLSILIYRWAFNDKSTTITALKKQVANPEFLNWITDFDKQDFKKFQKQNMEPYESIFLRLGAVVLKNAQNFLAVNPSNAVQAIKSELAQLIRELETSNDIKTLDKLKVELGRIQKLGGFEAIVPSEGIVFTYKGNTYKLTGAFAPVNQILGVLKYQR